MARNPDIQRLLANLRGGGLVVDADNFHPQQASGTAGNASTPSRHSIPGLGLLPNDELQRQPVTVSRPSTPKTDPRLPVQSTVSRESSATPAPPDSSTITTWPAALKYVAKHVVNNERAANKIKHLISEQHKHERQWWAGREAIVVRHSGRAGNQAKVADLLKSLGGAAVPVAAHDPKADKTELEAYDKKVYKGVTDMAADFDRQLRGLQIPFFSIKHELVILDDGKQRQASTKGKLDKGELRELQRRMIETLEDLVGDE